MNSILDNQLSIPIKYLVSRNDWFTFLSIRNEYDKILDQWKQYFYFQMINQFSKIEYPNGWAFKATPIFFEELFKKLKFTWYLKEYETPYVGFQCIIEKDFFFGPSFQVDNVNMRDLYNSEEFQPLKYFFDEKLVPLFVLSPMAGINDREMLLWEIGNNQELIVKINLRVKHLTESSGFTELFIILNKAYQTIKT